MRKRIAVALALSAGLALLTAPASAGASPTVITTAPIKVRGYQMTVVGSDAKKDGLTVVFSRRAKKSTQSHIFTFDKKVKVTGRSINARLGRFGRINLRFGPLTNVKGRSKLPAGCTGRAARTKTGTLRGQLRFVADRNFFRTIKTKSIRGTVTSGGRLKCAGTGDGTGGDGMGDGGFGKGEPMLTLSKQDGDAMLTMTATKNSVTVFKMESRKQTSPAMVMRTIVAPGRGSLVVMPDASATVKSQKPFLVGTGLFSPTQNLGVMATGTLGGNLVAKFDSIGRQSLTGDATLLNP